MIKLGAATDDHLNNENDEADIEARLTKMLGGVGEENQPLLKDGETTQTLMQLRMTAAPQFSILKARPLGGTNLTMTSSRMNSRFDRKGHLIDESTVKNYEVTFADNVKEVEKLADVIVVESYKEHNYDNTHQPAYPICPCCSII